jgi:hypothetical protein
MRTHRVSDVEPDVMTVDTPDVQVRESTSRFSPAQVVHGAIGVFLIVLGAITMARGDLSGDLTEPEVDILGITHSAAVGIGELVAGALLLVAAASAFTRILGLLVGLGLIAFGVVLLGNDDAVQDLGTEDTLAWLAIGLGAAAAVFGLIPGRRLRRRTIVR